MNRMKKGVKPFLLFSAMALILVIGYRNLEYNWQWYRVKAYLLVFENGRFIKGPLLEGLWITLKISFLGLFLSLFLGLLSALARLSASPVLRLLAWIYIETIRNTPLLIQIFCHVFCYFPGIGYIGFPLGDSCIEPV